MKALRWLSARFKDLFYDANNLHLDAGRVLGWLIAGTLISSAVWNAHLGKEIDLSATGFPGGLAAVLTALVIYVIKDRKQASE